jgi:hypothetical protein
MSRSLCLRLLGFVAISLAAACAFAQSEGELRCAARKVKAAATAADAKLRCVARASRQAAAVDDDCLADASEKQSGSFVAAESGGQCRTEDDAAGVGALSDDLASSVAATIPPGATDASRVCAARKQGAAGKQARARLTCLSRSASHGVLTDVDCVAKARGRFDRAFANAEAAGGCATSGDADTVETLVDEHVRAVTEALVPICGDDLAGPGEACDGTADASCPGACASSCVCPGACGDGTADPPIEECDDGDVASGDGCSSACQLESAAAACAGVGSTPGTVLGAIVVASGLNSPVHVAAPPLDTRRVFVVEQPGRIRVVRDGALQATPFLDIVSKVASGGERGLLSVAFHPDYEQNRRFFVNYTRTGDGATVIARYTAVDDEHANAASELVLATIAQPFSNHNGGQIAFGADGYLYVGMGDGGGGGDPLEAGQDDAQVLGKLLRLNVDVATAPYWSAPPDNPNPAAPGLLAAVWAKGLRNPWRFSFDRQTNDLYIGDVGQGSFEELDYAPAPLAAGLNYGWDVFEASACFEPDPDPVCPSPPTGFTFPVHQYSHAAGCSVTGGFVYRGCALPDLRGTYFYSDYCSGWIRTFGVSGGVAGSFADRTNTLEAHGFERGNTSSFGEDARGELYIADLGGSVWKIVPGN